MNLAAVGDSAPLRGLLRGRIIRGRDPTERASSTSTGLGHRRQAGAHDERAVGVDAVLELAAGERDALGEPDQAGPRPGQRRDRGDGHRREAANLDLQVAVGRVDG